MNLRVVFLAFIPVVALLASCTKEPRHSHATTDPEVLAERMRSVLPEGWSITALRRDYMTGREGIYILAENPSIKLSHPKVIQNAHVALYFRPKDSTSLCLQIQLDGSIYSCFLGSTSDYNVYGGSVGVPLDEEIKKALQLRQLHNNEMQPIN